MRARARGIWLAAMSSIARVIFFVESTARMRRRRARSAPPGTSAPRRGLRRRRGGREARLRLFDRGRQRALVGEGLLLADVGEQLRVGAPQVGAQRRLEGPDVLDGDVV